MDEPVNAARAKKDMPEDEAKTITFMGNRVSPDMQVRIAIGVAVGFFLLLVGILLFVPSGIPFLAAKNGSGLFSYIGLFFIYMLGYYAVVMLTMAAIAGILYLVQA